MHTRDMTAPAVEMMMPATTAAVPAWAVWRARLVNWFTRCADQWAAQAAYEELSRLSDERLEQQGLPRDTLARDLSKSTTRPPS
jgi:hypothetical protein